MTDITDRLESASTTPFSALLQSAAMEIKLLRTKVSSLQQSLDDRIRTALDAQRQNEWLRERLRECQAPSSSLPD